MSAIFSIKNIQDMDVKFEITTRQKTVFGCLRVTRAQEFLLDIPIDWLGHYMSSVE